jgi:hypothetical protein
MLNPHEQKELFFQKGAGLLDAGASKGAAWCRFLCEPRRALSASPRYLSILGAERLRARCGFLGNVEKAKAGPADKFSIQLSVVPAAMRAPATMRTATTRTMWRGSAVARRRIRACWRRVGS